MKGRAHGPAFYLLCFFRFAVVRLLKARFSEAPRPEQGTGLIDLPIMREKATQWPIVPGTSLKGVLREAWQADSKQKSLVNSAFGIAGDDNALAGALCFGDSHLLLLPIRAMKGTFAWATCPSLLKRHKRDLKSFGRPEIPDEPILTDDTKYLCGKGHISQIPPQVNEFILEDMKLNYNSEPNADLWAEYLAKIFEADWQIEFKKRFIIVSDSVFDFLAEVGTEVRARICIDDDTGTARKGALWYEESLPAETVLAGMVWQDPGLSKEQDLIANLLPNSKELRFGGKGSTGLGRVRIVKGA